MDSEDYINLAKKMLQFKNDSAETRKKMSEKAYDYYEENFKKENVIKKLLDILKEEDKNV